MFDFNIFNNAEPLDLYLCKPTGRIVCELNGIQDESTSLTVNLNNQYELTFDYDKYINIDGVDYKSNGYNKLSYGMNILVPGIGLFMMEYPRREFDGTKHYKSITAHSIDCEFENKYLTDFKINTGEETSQEYLVTYEDGETESLLNEYTGIPYDFIVFDNTYPQELAKISGKYSDGKYTDSATIAEIKQYCDLVPRLKSRVVTRDESSVLEEYVIYTYDSSGKKIISVELVNFNTRIVKLIDFYTKYHDQLSLIPLTLNMAGCDWTVGEIDPSLANKKFKFDVTTNVYAFFTQDVAGAAERVFDFDLLHKKINVRLIENIGKSSDVFIDKYNLLNNMEISCEENHLYTRYTVSGGNDMDIRDVNFGDNVITDLTYQMKVRDDDGELIYVTEELAEKYFRYVADREIAREKYIELKTQYNQLLLDVDDLKYKVPDDVCKTAWGTYSMEELEAADKSYTNLLNTLLTLYKEEYGTNGLNSDGSVKESVMKDTIYWNDYQSYQQALVQIKAAAEALNSGSNYSKIKDGTNQDLIKAITAYETQWDLYGTVELQNKVDAYNNQMKCCVQKNLVLYDNSETAIPWNQLSDGQKKEFQDSVSYTVIYDEYTKALQNRNNCQTYLDTLLARVSEKESQMEQYKKQYSDIVKLVSLQGYNRTDLGKIVALENPSINAAFTADDIRTINLLYVDNTYSNENILTTSLDNIVTQIEVERELLADAQEKLSAASKPQMTYSIDMDAILCMPEFKNYDFVPGNFVYVEYMDDYYVKLRLFTMQFNPRIPYDPPKVTFTNYVSSKAKRSDLSYILAQTSGNGSGGGSSGGGSGGNGAFGTGKDIDVTISNTMLSKMLNTELFATRVTDVVLDNAKVNNLNAKMATFGGLADGTTIIDGKCIKTSWIIDSKYNGDKTKGTITNTAGTIINLDTGSFSFAGGRIKFDSSTNKLTFGSDVTLSWSQVTGTDNVASTSDIPTKVSQLKNDSGYQNSTQVTSISRNEISTASIKAGQIKTGTIVSTDGSTTKINLDDGTFSFAGGKLTWNKTTLLLEGNINTTGGTIAGWVINSGGITKITDTRGVYVLNGTDSNKNFLVVNELNTDGTWKSTPFYVRADGTMYAKHAQLVGGTIGGWTITSTDLYNSTSGVSSSGSKFAFWAGESNSVHGASNTNATFKVGHNGVLVATGATITGVINATSGTFNNVNIQTGTIGGFTITSGKIYGGTENANETVVMQKPSDSTTFVFAAGGNSHNSYKDCPFRVTKNGTMIAEKATITGSITAENMYVKNRLYVYESDVNKKLTALESVKDDIQALYVGSGFDGCKFGSYTYFLKPMYIFDTITTSGNIMATGTTTIGGTLNVGTTGQYLKSNSTSTKISNLYFDDWSGTNRKPASSASSDGSRVGYIASKVRTSDTQYYITVQGQYGTKGDKYSTHNYLATDSDVRLKTNIQPTNIKALPVVNRINMRQFDWKATGTHQDIGVVADELEKIDSGFTVGGGYNQDGSMDVKSVNTFYLMGYLIKAIQELSEKLDILEKQIKQ